MFTLVAEDGETSNRGIAIFTVTITDVNDNYPQFTRNEYHFRVREDAITSVAIGTVEATDLDSGFNSKIEYRLQPSPFGMRYSYYVVDNSFKNTLQRGVKTMQQLHISFIITLHTCLTESIFLILCQYYFYRSIFSH